MDVSAFISSLASSHPFIMTVLTVIGVMRVVLKPAFTLLHQALGAAGATTLDGEVTAVEQSKLVSGLFYVLDWIGSIQIAKPSVLVAAPQTAVVPASTVTAIQAAAASVTPAPAASSTTQTPAA